MIWGPLNSDLHTNLRLVAMPRTWVTDTAGNLDTNHEVDTGSSATWIVLVMVVGSSLAVTLISLRQGVTKDRLCETLFWSLTDLWISYCESTSVTVIRAMFNILMRRKDDSPVTPSPNNHQSYILIFFPRSPYLGFPPSSPSTHLLPNYCKVFPHIFWLSVFSCCTLQLNGSSLSRVVSRPRQGLVLWYCRLYSGTWSVS